eukprot:TRINITY_DN7205_c1_g5_i1.p2 TRINITY_DN7205_c1_g5~~TRINITY_DN7205_c1_g5_i1.p2  ORF type:complete len:246 (+),score=82.87 TRINITY_DN7205_c1_g5_i1:54-791(+)
MSVQKMLLVSLVVGVAFTVVRADDDMDEDEDEKRNTQVTIKTIFPELDSHNVQLVAGKETQALVNFENAAESTYQVEFITAHLASTAQADHVMQNLTGALVNRTVNQGESISMTYKFTPFKDIDPREYGLVLQVYFMTEDDERAHETAYNATVMVNDGSSAFDAQSVFLTIIVLGVSVFAYTTFKGDKKPASSVTARRQVSASPAPELGTTTATSNEAAYISNDHIKATRNRSTEGRSKSPKSKK